MRVLPIHRPAWRCGVMLAVLAFSPPVAAEEAKQSVMKETADHIWRDQKRMLTAPLRTSRNDLIVWSIAGASLLVLAPEWNGNSSLDERFEQNINREDHAQRPFLKTITHLGDAPVLIGSSLVTFGVATWQKQPKVATASLHVFEGLIDTGIAVYLIKMLTGRSRPVEHPVDSSFYGPAGFFGDSNNDSFPSGHSAMSFAAATIVSHESGKRWVGLTAYGLAATVSYSRVYVEKHWASDVIAGAVLGYSIGVLVEKHRHARDENSSMIVPNIRPDSVGLAWVKTW